MLEGKVVELNIVTRASDNTIGRTLKNVLKPTPFKVLLPVRWRARVRWKRGRARRCHRRIPWVW